MKSSTSQTLLLIWIGLGATLASGCRFGNFAEDPKPRENYRSVEMFFTEAKHLATASFLDGDDRATENPQAPLSAIPSSIRRTLTNPVYFAVPIDPERPPFFVDLNIKYSLETTINAQGQVEDTFVSDISTLWKDPNCITQVEITQRGGFDRSQSGTVAFPDQTTARVEGRLGLTLSYLRVIAGDCSQELTRLASCYESGTECDADEIEAANSLYDLYIRQTGVLNINDAPRVRGLAYEVKYE
jgi:hypothetical protein